MMEKIVYMPVNQEVKKGDLMINCPSCGVVTAKSHPFQAQKEHREAELAELLKSGITPPVTNNKKRR